ALTAPTAVIAALPSLKPINAVCPVSGTPVDPRYTIVYEGKVIGFCCPNCPKKFWDDPKAFAEKLK
ncbi:MAG: YHS domain-containing protein, partial [Phycisphaerae bacterium]|nr:YHS domain-containing protein [Phycisphaerae bacterium]